MEDRPDVVEGVIRVAPGRHRLRDLPAAAIRLGQRQLVRSAMDMARAGDDASRLRHHEVSRAKEGGAGPAGTRHRVLGIGLAVLDVHPVGMDLLHPAVRGRVRLDRDLVLDEGVVGHVAVVHHHVEQRPVRVVGLVAVAGRQRQLRSLLSGRVEALRGGDPAEPVPEGDVAAGAVQLGQVHEDDVVEHQPADRDRRTAGIDDVGLHMGDVAGVGGMRGEVRGLQHLVGRDADRHLVGALLGGGAGGNAVRVGRGGEAGRQQSHGSGRDHGQPVAGA